MVWDLVDGAPERLVPGGMFTCVAQTKHGAKSLRAHIESVFGNVQELEKEGGYRVLHTVPPAPGDPRGGVAFLFIWGYTFFIPAGRRARDDGERMRVQ